MTKDKVKRVLQQYGELFPSSPAAKLSENAYHDLVGDRVEHYAALSHLKWMAATAQRFVDEGRMAKAMRWLGCIQGALWALGYVTLDDLKNHSKPADGEELHEFVWLRSAPGEVEVYASEEAALKSETLQREVESGAPIPAADGSVVEGPLKVITLKDIEEEEKSLGRDGFPWNIKPGDKVVWHGPGTSGVVIDVGEVEYQGRRGSIDCRVLISTPSGSSVLCGACELEAGFTEGS